MAERALVSVAGGIIGSVTGPLVAEQFKLLWGMKKELWKLESTVKAIEAVLEDAEAKQVQSRAVGDWLGKLSDVLYEADDLLDSVSIEALRQKVLTQGKEFKKLRIFFLQSKKLFNDLRMANKIKDIREKLDHIKDERNFHLAEGPVERRVRLRDTAAYLGDEIIIGREDDKKAVIELLDANDEVNVSIVSIVGIGGLGKTSLARLIFNDKEFTKKFDQTLWACVADEFDVNIILEKILESAKNKNPKANHVNTLVTNLREEINGKRYFLVLDDVWNEDHRKWSKLKGYLKSDVKGSRILVTTRSAKVANVIMQTNQYELKGSAKVANVMQAYQYELKGLDENESWDLFKQTAFENPKEPIDALMMKLIRDELNKKCRGVPLAVKTVGWSLRSQSSQYWLSFKETELSSPSPQNSETDILPTLKLSYDKLPSRLKHCFAYCSLFPKDYKYDRLTLISLWMAQGFIESRSNQCLEDVGDEYFKDLLFGSFFQEAEMDYFGDIVSCKMHDLMHDLATSVAESLIGIAGDKKRNINEKNRFIAFHVNKVSSIHQFSIEVNTIRTFLCLAKLPFSRFERDIICKTIFSSFMILRVLSLCGIGLECLPSSISKLKHLRYLDISQNEIVELPQSITKLQNLQTLNVGFELLELPRSFSKLVNLRQLIIDGKLKYMPRGLGQLTSLERLSLFIVDESSLSKRSASLHELNGLNNLGGRLEIRGLRHVKGLTLDYYKAMNLRKKSRVSYLTLSWSCTNDVNDVADDTLLDGLQPHPNLKQLNLYCYPGSRLSTWILSLKSLVVLSIDYPNRCQSLLSLSQLPCLKRLCLQFCLDLRYLSDCNDKNRFSLSSSDSVQFFPMLEVCTILSCHKLRGWWKGDSCTEGGNGDGEITTGTSIEVPRLSYLRVDSCPMLTTMPACPRLETLSLNGTSPMLCVPSTNNSLSELKYLNIGNCPELELGNLDDGIPWQCLKSLVDLCFWELPKFFSLPLGLQYVTTLRTLDLDCCSGLITIPEWIHNFKSLESLEIFNCSNLTSLPKGMSGLSSLQRLRIEGCPLLQKRCKRDIGEDWPKIKHIPNLQIPSHSHRRNASSEE